MPHHDPASAARPSDLKLNNRIQILELFKRGAIYSVADISRQIGISRQTVMKAIQFFLDRGILVSDGKAASGKMGGKRAELFSLSADKYLFNVVICPNCVYVSLFNTRADQVGDFTRRDIMEMGIDEIINIAGEACAALMRENDIERSAVRGVCITTPGIVEQEPNRVRFNALFPEWGRNVSLAGKLRPWFDKDTMIITENVGRVCGSVYLYRKPFCDSRGVTVFSSWGGVVACLMRQGHIMNGKDELIGEIGHMVLAPDDDEVCGCGGRGCFERQVSVERLRRIALEHRNEYPDSAIFRVPLEALTIPKMFELSQAGDALAGMLSEYTAHFFANALRNLMLVYNPYWVMLQGDYAFADERFRRVVKRELDVLRFRDMSRLSEFPFMFDMDKRTIKELTTRGAYTMLIDRMFGEETSYS